MTTKAAFITALGGALLPLHPGAHKTFARDTGDIFTASAHGLQSGAGPYKVMTAAGDAPSGLTPAVHASTFVTASSVVATDVITIDGKAYTFIATPADDGDIDVGANDTVSMGNLAAAINQIRAAAAATFDLDTAPNPRVLAEVTGAGILTIFARTLDATIGNAIPVVSSDGTMVVDNALLENGASGTDYYVIRVDDDSFSLATSRANAEAGTAVTIADAGTGVHRLVPTVQTLADSMEEVLQNYLTATGSRVHPADYAEARFWQAMIDGTAAGSVA